VAVELHRHPRARNRAAVEFEPIHQLRAHEYVAEQIRRHIALRLIGPGESLPSERDLAGMFGVGRPTIQHAIALLEADRLVEARRGRRGGTFVCKPPESADVLDELMARVLCRQPEIEELLVFRRAVEPRVAAQAARTRSSADVSAMSQAIASMSSATSEPEYMRHDTGFHLAVARATRNRFMLGAVEDTRMRLAEAMSLLPESATWHRRLSGEHEAVLAAVQERDAFAAEHAMNLHVAASEQGVRAVLAAISRRLAE
jgi:DNA-binding FadR family transcriptional regulator